MKNYYNEFINFLKKHNIYNEEILNYINTHSDKFDPREEERYKEISCCNKTDANNVLKEIKLCVPFMYSQKAVIINIHEYVEVMIKYKFLGKKYKNNKAIKTLPMLYETLYVLENPSEELNEFINSLNARITIDSPIEYKIALNEQKKLLEYYQNENPSFKKLENKAKKLTRKYKENNR